MNVQELTEHARDGHVRELNLISIEGGIYLLEVCLDDMSRMLKTDDGKTLHLRSVEHARDLLKTLPIVPFFLVHAVAHDELCGMPASGRTEMRLPIAFRSSWS